MEKTKLDQVYATALAADEGLLWVGTSVGVTLVFPLPRLEGIPLVSGKNCHPCYLDCNGFKGTPIEFDFVTQSLTDDKNA